MSAPIAKFLLESQEEIEKRKKRLLSFWQGNYLGRAPLTFIPGDCSPRQIFDDVQLQLKRAETYFKKMLTFPGDGVPIFWPDMGPVTLASVFGGEVVRESDGHNLWIKPLGNDIEEVAEREPPQVLSALVKQEFDRCCRWRDLTEGLGYVSPPDLQGPVNIACLLMPVEELLPSMYTHPELVHRLLRMCTDVILEVLKVYRKEFGPCLVPVTWPHVWFPDGFGVTLTQDSLPFLSPSLYREFELPLVKEISAANGGVYVHCCGECEHVLSDLATINNLRGFDHAYPHSHAPVILEKLGLSVVLTSGLSSRGTQEYSTQAEYLLHLLPRLPKNAKLWHILWADQVEQTKQTLDVLGLPDIKQKYEQTWKLLSS